MDQCTFNEKDQMTDLLQGEKYLAGCYNSYLLESATPEVKQCLSGLLNDTHSMQQQLFEEMNSRGFYPVTKAEDQKLNTVRQQFCTKVSR